MTQLNAFKKANKAARERMAIRNGFADVETFIAWLKTGQPIPATAVAPKKSRGRGKKVEKEIAIITIHNVQVIDVSSSMNDKSVYNGPKKIDMAIQGVNAEINALQEDNSVNYTNTIFCFATNVRTEMYMTPMSNVKPVSFIADGWTALNDAVGEAITRVRASKKYDEKAIIKVFTDGGENRSRKYSPQQIKDLIAEVEGEGITVAFVGTTAEVAFAMNNYGVDGSNTFIHDNTTRGVQASYLSMASNTMNYASKVLRKKDVKKNFFEKKIGKL